MSESRWLFNLHPKTRELIEQNSGKECCVPYGDQWFICDYHKGYDDALREAEVAATDNKDAAIAATKIIRLEDEVKRLRITDTTFCDCDEGPYYGAQQHPSLPRCERCHHPADPKRYAAEAKVEQAKADAEGWAHEAGRSQAKIGHLEAEVETLTGMVSALRAEVPVLQHVEADFDRLQAENGALRVELRDLCVCSPPPNTDGPQRECPVHGEPGAIIMEQRYDNERLRALLDPDDDTRERLEARVAEAYPWIDPHPLDVVDMVLTALQKETSNEH